MTKEGDNYRHNDNKKLYRILPDINGDRLEKSHEGQGYGYIFEEVIEVYNEWSGWGTALKPAHEPIALARKPMKGSIRDNVVKHGVGAINIDATRIDWDDEAKARNEKINASGGVKIGIGIERYGNIGGEEQSNGEKVMLNEQGRFPSNVIGEIPDYQKYFYCPKVSRRERHIGMEDPGPQTARARDAEGNVLNYAEKKAGASANVLVEQFQLNDKGNNHPTVKPIELMKYLIKLITPKGGVVLDPFNGSGSTGCAAVELGCEYVGIELDPKYVEIAEKRIEAWNKEETTFTELFA
jgi:site-specific DNA-methyltransferase (adenine-specific)